MLKYWIWLAERKGLRNQTRLALLSRFASPEAVFRADEAELLAEGIDRTQLTPLKDHDLDGANRILEACQRLNISLLTYEDAGYPGRLRNIFDPPLLLYVKGRLPQVDDEVSVAVVGTRDCTPYGTLCADRFGCGLARGGALVVTGLAKGIDTAAAKGALRGGGRVIGVLGNGIDVIYPRKNRGLYEDVAANGVLLSEYPPGTEPASFHFPVRNRILAGLSLGVLVVEAPARSGALITAENALEQGKDVFAVPGPINAPNSVGCNRLIRSGAGLVMDAADILWEYEARYPARIRLQEARQAPIPESEAPEEQGASPQRELSLQKEPPPLRLSDAELTDDQVALLELLSSRDPMLTDDLIERSGLPARQVLCALTGLEIEGFIKQHSGKRYTRAVTLIK